jgi:dienelactone hydrolase
VRRIRRPSVAALVTALLLVAGGAAQAQVQANDSPATRVADIKIQVPKQQPLRAYLVLPGKPARPHRASAVLFLHWFAPPAKDSDRTEFLAEAVRLADQGVVSLLPQLSFPWAADPVGDRRDAATIEAQLVAVQHAFDALSRRPEVDRNRVAVVGHDYGAMYGLDLAARNPRVAAVVSMAADATWSNWFNKYWLGLEGEAATAYARLFGDLDPVVAARTAGARPLYFQWSSNDIFVPAEVRAAFSAAAPSAKVSVYDRVEHELGVAALTDRDAWLIQVLSH